MTQTVLSAIESGAIPDGKTLNSVVLQKAIDSIDQSGGGTLLLSPGLYLTGVLRLCSNLTIELQAGAILMGSPDIKDYPVYTTRINPDGHKDLQPHHLLIVDNKENVVIRGSGVIDGNGPAFWDPPTTCEFFTSKAERVSPLIELRESSNVVLDGVTIANSPGWTVHVNRCKQVRIRGITIANSLIGPNTDGLDITDSSDVFVSDSNLVCGDDAIVLKSLGGVNERIVVTNCVTRTRCSALKLGANESYGTIRQVAMSNCVVYGSSRGISLYCMTGGTFEDITFSNIILDCHNDMKLVCPIHINCSRNPDKKRPQKIGRIRNVRISDVLCRSDARILLTNEDGGMLENIMLHNIHMEYPVVENEFELAARAVGLQFSPYSPDARAARAVVAASNIKGLIIQNVTVDWPQAPGVDMSVLWARNIQGGLVDCPLAKPSSADAQRYDIENCTLTIRD